MHSTDHIALLPCTNARWHEYAQRYVPDLMMTEIPYAYDQSRAEEAYRTKAFDPTRRYFFIHYKDELVGEIYLKHIDQANKTTEFGVALIDDAVKGKGYGTEAIRQLLQIAFEELGMQTVFADSVLRNTRSQHVLEKLGFRYTHEDEIFKYYRLDAPNA